MQNSCGQRGRLSIRGHFLCAATTGGSSTDRTAAPTRPGKAVVRTGQRHSSGTRGNVPKREICANMLPSSSLPKTCASSRAATGLTRPIGKHFPLPPPPDTPSTAHNAMRAFLAQLHQPGLGCRSMPKEAYTLNIDPREKWRKARNRKVE